MFQVTNLPAGLDGLDFFFDFSPDGQQIAYVVTELDREADRSRSSVWIASLDGELFRLADGSMPRWSPDGRRLACVSKGQLYVLSPLGGDHPYYAEFGWTSSDAGVKVPGPDSLWTASNTTLAPDKPVRLTWDNGAGLIFGLRGSIEKVTNKVFLLSPSNVDVSAEDKRRIREGGFYNQS